MEHEDIDNSNTDIVCIAMFIVFDIDNIYTI